MADEIKIGAYICKGCGLGEHLEGAQLTTIAQRDAKAHVVKEHDFRSINLSISFKPNKRAPAFYY